jgi:xanthine dehydrogenase YagR molybdenum-binding subunit
VETGKVRVLKYVAVQDSGLVVNPTTWESQVIGAVIQAWATPLWKNAISTQTMPVSEPESARLQSADGARDSEIVVLLDHEPERGVIGIGEPPIIAPAGAIANAVFNATGVRMHALPITPDKFLMEMRQARQTATQA